MSGTPWNCPLLSCQKHPTSCVPGSAGPHADVKLAAERMWPRESGVGPACGHLVMPWWESPADLSPPARLPVADERG